MLLIQTLMVHMLPLFSTLVDHECTSSALLLLTRLSILQGKFVNDYSFALVGKACALPVNVLVVAMADNLAAG